MSNPANLRERIRASILATLDASELDAATDSWPATTEGGDNIDHTYPASWVDHVIDTAAAEVVAAVAEAADHPLAGDLMTLTGPYAWRDRLDAHLGRPGAVLVTTTGNPDDLEPAYERSQQGVEWRRRNYARVGAVGDEYYYVAKGEEIFFSGGETATAYVYLVVFDPDADDGEDDQLEDLPEQLVAAVEAAALSRLAVQQLKKVDAGRYFELKWQAAYQRLLAGGVPDRVEPYKESA
jgi:hypothetical protein